jgi:hypothetical protein
MRVRRRLENWAMAESSVETLLVVNGIVGPAHSALSAFAGHDSSCTLGDGIALVAHVNTNEQLSNRRAVIRWIRQDPEIAGNKRGLAVA